MKARGPLDEVRGPSEGHAAMPNEQLEYILSHQNEPCPACSHPLSDHTQAGKVVPCRSTQWDHEDVDPNAPCGCGMEC